ncbi:hypothetical protein [Cohnella sp. REN36]|uniref:hypothetical protein n=1 Tax=Cohnella sp. REN36 TaxID=2887347 RepID=UPI001D15CF14|nr:hypothetical protein [Cohnella sp. REN36]MCC3373214.1 hypothetical protein [Cohnella sp. REN36]
MAMQARWGMMKTRQGRYRVNAELAAPPVAAGGRRSEVRAAGCGTDGRGTA